MIDSPRYVAREFGVLNLIRNREVVGECRKIERVAYVCTVEPLIKDTLYYGHNIILNVILPLKEETSLLRTK